MSRRVLIPALILLAGIAIFVALRLRHRGDTPVVPSATTAPAAPAPAPVAAAHPPQKSGTLPDVVVTSEDDPAGGLRLEGQVVDAEERPVLGATVTLSSNPPRHVKTEGDGSFAFDKLIGRTYAVDARKEGAAANPMTVRLTTRTEPVILRLRDAAMVEVTVLTEERKPISGAAVELAGAPDSRVTTDPDGKARLIGVLGGWQVIKASAAGFAPQGTPFEAAGRSGTVEKQTIELKRGAPVSGRVVDTNGKPVAGARVLPEATASWNALGDDHDAAVISDADGRWAFPALPSGTFRFNATHAAHAPGASAPIALDGLIEKKDVLIKLEDGARVAGRVQTRAGAPVAGAAVRVVPKDAGFRWDVTRQIFTDDKGEFEMGGLARAPIELVAISESASSQVVAVDLAAAAEQRGVVITLDVEGSIAGVVVSPTGETLTEVQVSAVPELGERQDFLATLRLRGFSADVTDSAGHFELHGLPDGNYRLRAIRGGQAAGAIWQRAGVPAHTGDKDVKLVLESDGRVVGKVAFADGTVPDLYAVSSGTARGTTFSAPDGAFAVEAQAGVVTLSVSGLSFEQKTVGNLIVKGGADTDAGTITVAKGRSISGRVLDATGEPVSGAKIVAGARLFASGTDISSPFGGPGMKTTTSDDDGGYLLTGVGATSLVLAADHPTAGRSSTLKIPASTASVQVDLHLGPLGTLDGRVTAGGQPVSKALVLATPQTAAAGNFMVTTGDDGIYHYDKLAPDNYVVSAARGGGIGGASLTTRSVIIAPGQAAHMDIDMPVDGVTLTLHVAGPPGVTVATAQLFLMSGQVTASTVEQLTDAYAARGDGSFHQGFVFKGQPLVFDKITPGVYTVCGIPIPGDINSPADMVKLQSQLDQLLVVCGQKVVAAQPPTQDITVTLPAPPPL